VTKCFFVTQTNRAAQYLRRYKNSYSDIRECPGKMSYHDAMNYVGDVDIRVDLDGCWSYPDDSVTTPHEDPRWPSTCECGYAFDPKDIWQHFHDRLYTDGTQFWPHRQLPVGAMYYAEWLPKDMYWDNKEDGNLYVVTPGGEWCIDSRASNCTMPEDRLHRCWVRHGVPPDIHVDKAGNTCGAGAGSIALPTYHGFLHHGHLT
jgi:hypothetical protein